VSETTLLTGIQVTDLSSAEKAAANLRERGVSTVILTLGEQGALLANARGMIHVPGYSVEVVDTTAAGDAFVGGFAVALAEGQALAVTRLGAQPSLPTRREIELFLARHAS